MRRPIDPRLTRTRRRPLAVPFVITFAAAGAACGVGAQTVPNVDQPPSTEVSSNPAPPDESEGEVFISNPAEPQPELEPVPEDELVVIANPAFPGDG